MLLYVLLTTPAVVFCVVCQFGIQLSDANSKILGTFCARNERDRTKFVDDLKEAILEVSPYQSYFHKAIIFSVVLFMQFKLFTVC